VAIPRVAIKGASRDYEVRGAGEPVAWIQVVLYADFILPLMDQPAPAGQQ
jgi:hypothetical protein